ncbi:MAG TPA: MFS transporter [Candidatus Scatomorpha gallistercoris]|nr:MFS transporter [Candidatus Scatomorpha gallistercoris]
MNSEKKFFGYKAAVGAFLVMFVNLGACTTLGIFLTSLSEYSGWDLGMVGYIGTVNTIGNVVLSIVAVKALSKLGARTTMLISVLACAIHVHLYTFATPGANISSLVFYYLAGFMASFSITFGTHAVCSSVIADWFVEKREQISGVVFSGAGFGAAIWVFAAGQLFKVVDFKGCYRILSIFILAIGLFSVICLIKDPKKLGQKPLGWDKASTDSTGESVEVPGVSKSEALRAPAFWVLAAALLFVCMSGSAYMSYAPSWWQTNGLDATAAANWNAIYLVISGAVLLAVGKVFAKTGPKAFTVIVCAAFVAAMACMVALNGHPATLILVGCVVFAALAYPLNASIPGLIGQSVFGGRDFAAISATLMTGVYIGQALTAPVMNAFLATEGGMGTAWIFFGATALVGMVLIIISISISPMKKKA